MLVERVRGVVSEAGATAAALRSAFGELLTQEFDWSAGHLTALLNGCVFAPQLLTFWFVNGVADFSTAIVLGTVASPGGLQVRLLAYLLVVPVFVAVRAGYYLVHPVHRRAILSGTCPKSRVLSLDWFTVGILMTGLPLAFRDLGLWVGTNAVFVLGIFVLPRFVAGDRRSLAVKLGAIAVGLFLFGYVKAGGAMADAVGVVPEPAAALGPIATATLRERDLALLLRLTNSLLTGPFLVALVGYVANRVMTHPAVTEIPLLHYTLPERDPWRVVAVSASLGTVFYLLFLAAFTGRFVLVP
jgi:hypothetical protein